MTLSIRLEKLFNILQDEFGYLEYDKMLPRLKFHVMYMTRNEDDEIIFCMEMDTEIKYIKTKELTIVELQQIVQELETML